jgi:hypothetical protein
MRWVRQQVYFERVRVLLATESQGGISPDKAALQT